MNLHPELFLVLFCYKGTKDFIYRDISSIDISYGVLKKGYREDVIKSHSLILVIEDMFVFSLNLQRVTEYRNEKYSKKVAGDFMPNFYNRFLSVQR